MLETNQNSSRQLSPPASNAFARRGFGAAGLRLAAVRPVLAGPAGLSVARAAGARAKLKARAWRGRPGAFARARIVEVVLAYMHRGMEWDAHCALPDFCPVFRTARHA